MNNYNNLSRTPDLNEFSGINFKDSSNMKVVMLEETNMELNHHENFGAIQSGATFS
jgi:hypothetical protein